MIDIAVIITAYNESVDVLDRSINSILIQSCQNFKLYITLDNPNNNDLKNLLVSKYNSNRKIHLIFNSRNLGPGVSRNRAIEQANSKYIAILDGDDTSSFDRLEKQFELLEQKQDIDVLFSFWNEIDIKTNAITVRKPNKLWFKKVEKYFFYKPMLLHASMMCRTDVLKKFPYPPIKRGEDFKLFLDLLIAGKKFSVIELPLYNYFVTKNESKIHRKKFMISHLIFYLYCVNISYIINFTHTYI